MKLSSRLIALTSVFSALHAVLYLLSFGLWRNWAIYLEPVEGIILGPWAGFFSALIGGILGRTIKPIPDWMFGIVAEPLGVLAAGFLAKGKWKPVIVIYVVMLAGYFLSPLGRALPLWTILDILLALALIIPVAILGKRFYDDVRRLPLAIPISFIATVTDSLTRVFLFIPVGLYTLFVPYEMVPSIFIAGAVSSYIEDGLVVVVSFLVGIPLLLALRRISGIKLPLT